MKNHHSPVLLNECLKYLVINKSGVFFDGTGGFGGHSEGILKSAAEDALLISTDVDNTAFEFLRQNFSDDKRVKIYNFNFNKIDLIAKIEGINSFDGVILDLGVSSYQLDSASAGFTYKQNADLDLRMDKSITVKASDIINSFKEKDIQHILYKYGEEKNSRHIASAICRERFRKKIETTAHLAEVIAQITSPIYLNKTLSRVFQALRIYINNELSVLETFIPKAINLLSKGGRIVILSYHSLEDRIVKEAFRFAAIKCICPKAYPVCKCEKKSQLKILTKKPVLPFAEEIAVNLRARSAKLRAAERI